MKKLGFTLRQFIFRSYLDSGNTTEICIHISKKSLANIARLLEWIFGYKRLANNDIKH
jgi:hypothetical protein